MLHHTTFDELADGPNYCLAKSIDDPEGAVAPKDAFRSDTHHFTADETQKDWFTEEGIAVAVEITMPSLALRIRCLASATQGMKTLFALLDTMRRRPKVDMLEHIHLLLQSS
jgi:hypothetical protein